ncbi:hypothetical protein SUDANB176_07197 [Streptomyces sp. enrichment culture]|uniref:hypothetical protein n=1 Tax=Streptomyces sp. enrichment culture TaxID=1795815 RepID=UPI003F5682ED
MGCLAAAARAAGAVAATWSVLVVLVFLPSLLPPHQQYYFYSVASVGLWMLSMLVAPVLVCIASRKWIAHGRRTSCRPD